MVVQKQRPLRFEQLEDRSMPSNVTVHWNEIMLQSLSISTAPVPVSRNLALVSVAMFDAVNAVTQTYEPYAAHVRAAPGASAEAAVAQAAHDTLVALFPSREAVFDAALAEDLAGIPSAAARQGQAVGQKVARQILELRSDDGSGTVMTWTPPNDDPGTYQLTGPNFAPASNFHFGFITPFAIENSSQFRPGPPPALDSEEYATDLNEVKVVGASNADEEGVDRDGNGLPDRTGDQTIVAELWRAALGNHTVWNRIAQNQATTNDLSESDTARLFALMNVALNDGLQTSFASKFHYELWRPITAIQRADEDGNDLTEAEADWMTEHPNTPPYPAYASNASTIGAACATVLTDVFGPDVSFEVNWSQGTRSYANFWAAADEQANARVYGGIHFRFDCVAGQGIGANVGEYVVDNYFQPLTASSGGALAAEMFTSEESGRGPEKMGSGLAGPALFLAPSMITTPGGLLADSGTATEDPEGVTEVLPANLQEGVPGDESSMAGLTLSVADLTEGDSSRDEWSLGPWSEV